MRITKISKLNNEQKQFILDNYSNMSNKEISENIGVEDISLIRSYAKNNNLLKNCNVKMIKHGIYNEIVNKNHDYIYNTMFLKEEQKVSQENLYKSKYGKYFVNQDYFEKIDTEWKAYWLGFLYADGTNRIHKNKKKNKMEYVVKIGLSSVDINHLYKFKKSLQSDSPIKTRKILLDNKNFECCDISICNQKICESLNDLGCTPNKSLTLKFPTEKQVPKYLLKHFIRGYFDGDGCVHINKLNKSTVINFVGTKDFLEGIRKVFNEELKIPNLTICQKNGQKAYQLSYSGIEEFEKIFEYLYRNSNICLDRKLDKFKIIL